MFNHIRLLLILIFIILLAAACAPAPTTQVAPQEILDTQKLTVFDKQRLIQETGEFVVALDMVCQAPEALITGTVDCNQLKSTKSPPAPEDSASPVVILVVDDFGSIPIWRVRTKSVYEKQPVYALTDVAPMVSDNCIMDPGGQGTYGARKSSATETETPHGELVFAELEQELLNTGATKIDSEASESCWKRRMALYRFGENQNVLLVGVDTQNYNTQTVSNNIEAAIIEFSRDNKFMVGGTELPPTNRFVINMSFAIVPCKAYNFSGKDKQAVLEWQAKFQPYIQQSSDPALVNLAQNLEIASQSLEQVESPAPTEPGQVKLSDKALLALEQTQLSSDVLGKFPLFLDFYKPPPSGAPSEEIEQYIKDLMAEIPETDALASLLKCYVDNPNRKIISVASAGNFGTYPYPFLPALLDSVVSVSADYSRIKDVCPEASDVASSNTGEVSMDGVYVQKDEKYPNGKCYVGTSFAAPRLSLQEAMMLLTGAACPADSGVVPPLGYATIYGDWWNMSLNDVLAKYCPGVPNNLEQPYTPMTVEATQVRPGPSVEAIYVAAPPIIDSYLDEWVSPMYPIKNLVYDQQDWQGDWDLLADVMFAWDDQNLYLAAHVHDENYIQPYSQADVYRGDGLEMLFDANLLEDFNHQERSEDDLQLNLSPGRDKPGNYPEAFLWYSASYGKPAEKVIIASISTDDGYSVEAAIPWETFGVFPQPGQQYGFSVSVIDNDAYENSNPKSVISLIPELNWADPTSWGTLLLIKY